MTEQGLHEKLNSSKISLLEVYLELQEYYETVYGTNTVVVMEVGSFFEVYGVDNDKEKIGKPKEIADILNLQLTRKNKSIKENSAKNPLMAGFPTATFDRYVSRLVQEKKYTIVIVRQKGAPPNVTRYVSQIISPGINMDYCLDHDDNFVASILVDVHKGIYSIGYAAIDVTTGKTYLFEGHGTKEDTTAALDELFRLLQSHKTAELLFVPGNESVDMQTVAEYLELSEFENIQSRKKRLNVAYQNELFKRAYIIKSFLSPIEFLDLEKQPLTSESFAHLLEFIVEHDHSVIENLKKPTIIEASQYLYLGNNPLEQLNIISRDPGELTLLSLFDKTTTSVGKRLFRDRLTNPITSKGELLSRYDLSDALAPIADTISTELRRTYDIERIARRISLSRLHPYEINYLYDTLQATAAILDTITAAEKTDVLPHFLSESGSLTEMIEHIEQTFNLDQTACSTQHTICKSLFQTSYNREIDALVLREAALQEKLETIRAVFIEQLKEITGKEETQFVTIKQLDKEGHYLSMTKSRYALIEDAVQKAFVSIDGTVYAVGDFSFKVQTGNVKITAEIIDAISEEIVVVQSKITALSKQLFTLSLAYLEEAYGAKLDLFAHAIAQIDVAIANSKNAIQRNLVRPEIVDVGEEESFLSATDLRHPLVESREEHGIYIPNSLVLGTKTHGNEKERTNVVAAQSDEDVRGLLLYGINSSGKSSLMKSLGMAIVLAQSGMYVPASQFRFSLATELFTRIVSKDNFEKGLSSFAVEMMELKNIFNRCSPKSLILGDEISHGTETLSAIAIVGATIKRLVEERSLFLFTTHLHQIHNLDVMKETAHVASAHMSVHYDKQADILVFDRILQAGSGSSIYGLEFAQSLHMDKDFLNYALDIRKGLAGEYSDLELLTQKQSSKYHAKLYLTSCALCGGPVDDTHHIAPQKEADKHGNIKHFHKNHKANLLPICKSCHDKIHEGKIDVEGFVMTDEGLTLQYKKKIED